ncbi:MAG: hypothetical protein Q9170_000508 [Blastenia crenularia]
MAITLSHSAPRNPTFKPHRPLYQPHALTSKSAASSASQPSTSKLLSLPPPILHQILSHLLISPSPVLLHRDGSTPPAYRTHIATDILIANRQLHHTSIPILYGKNTFTTSSPAISHAFDVHLLTLPGRMRLLIRKVTLEINWGKQLWMKFPLIAARLGGLKGLKELRLRIVDGAYGEGETELMQVSRKSTLVKRGGNAAKAMLKAEKTVLRELVVGLKGLRVFELRGFEDEEFARRLEEWVESGRKD